MKREANSIKTKQTEEYTESFATKGSINTDPNGMWTGVNTEDKYEKPIQDVDDL